MLSNVIMGLALLTGHAEPQDRIKPLPILKTVAEFNLLPKDMAKHLVGKWVQVDKARFPFQEGEKLELTVVAKEVDARWAVIVVKIAAEAC